MADEAGSPAEEARNGAEVSRASDQAADGATELAVQRSDAAAEPANEEPAGGERRHRNSHRGWRDRDQAGADGEAPAERSERSERRDHKKSRRSRGGDEEAAVEKKSRHRERDADEKKDRRSRDEKKDRKERDRSRERKSEKKEVDRERRRSRHRSSSRDRRRSRRSRSRSGSRARRSRHRSSSKRRRSRSQSPSRRRRHRSPSTDSEVYGGYVPRRPDPNVPQEKRRDAVWSLAGAGYGSSSYMDPYGAMRSGNTAAMTPEEIKRQMQEQQLKARQLVLQQQAASAVAAASKTQREVYIGNLVGGLVTEEALRQLFNNTMAAAFPDQMVSGLDAVVNVSMHSEGRYAFVELRTPEMASAALQLSGQVQLLGQPISVGRPSGYVDPTAAQQAAAAAAAALEQFQRGEISLEAAAAAGMPAPAPGTSPAPAGAAGVSPAPAAAAMGPPPGIPTAFLSVSGMVTAEVLADDEEYAEVIEDLRDECTKFGAVVAVTVPRPPDADNAAAVFGTGNFGKGFVQFADVEGARKAREAIHGRLFAGITVQVAFVSQHEFASAAQ